MNYSITSLIKTPSRVVSMTVPIPKGTGTDFDLVSDAGQRAPAQSVVVARHDDGSPQCVQLWGAFDTPARTVTALPVSTPSKGFFSFNQRAGELYASLRTVNGIETEMQNSFWGHTARRVKVVWHDAATGLSYIAWLTFATEEACVRLDYVIHNARPHARQLRVKGSEININPFASKGYEVVDTVWEEDGIIEPDEYYYFPQRARRIFRGTLYPTGVVSPPAIGLPIVGHGWGFGVATEAWQMTSCFTSLGLSAPKYTGIDVAGHLFAARQRALLALNTGGSYPGPNYVHSKRLGIWHPCFGLEGGETGGTWITQCPGVELASVGGVDGLLKEYCEQRMTTDRHHIGIVERTGVPAKLEDYLEDPNWSMRSDDGRFDKKSGGGEQDGPFGFSAQPKLPAGLCPEQAELDSFEPLDFAHLIRTIRSSITLAWLDNDPISRWLIRQEAEIARMSWVKSDLASDEARVDANPHKGLHYSRIHGWMLRAMAEAYSLGNPDLRVRLLADIGRILMVYRHAEMPNGAVNCDVNGKEFHKPPYSGQYGATVCIQHGLTTGGVYAASKATGIAHGLSPLGGVRFLLSGSETLWSAASRPKDVTQSVFLTRQVNVAGEPLDSSHPLYPDSNPTGAAKDSEQTRCTVGLVGLEALEQGDVDTLAEAIDITEQMLGAKPQAKLLSMKNGVLDSDGIMLAFVQRAGLP